MCIADSLVPYYRMQFPNILIAKILKKWNNHFNSFQNLPIIDAFHRCGVAGVVVKA